MGRGASSAAGFSSFGTGAVSAAGGSTGAGGTGATGMTDAAGGAVVRFLAVRFIVTVARAVVRVRIVHVVGNVQSVVLTQLDRDVFID